MNTHAGYSKRTLTDTSVLLAGGGDKPLSSFIGSIQYNSTSHKITYTTAAGVAADLVTLVTTDENVKQSPQDNNVNRPLMMINGGTGAAEQINTTIFSSNIYANTSTNMITAGGFIKSNSDNSYVLLGDGGHKSISDFHMFVNLSIGWANDFIRVVIALCVIDISNTGTDSNNIGTLYTRRLNGLCADSIAQVSFNNKYSGDYTYYYSLITNHENVGVSKTEGEGFRPCTFIYNNKHYAGLEFHLTQARAFYWHGSGTFTPFVVTFYNLSNLSVLNLEIYNSLTFGTGTKSLYHLYGSADTWYTARTLTIGNSGKSVNGSDDVSWTLTEIGIPAWAQAATKPSYNLDEVTDGTTRKLSDYITFVGVTDDTTNHANLLRYVKNGVSSYFTVPYATHSNTTTYIKCLGVVDNTKDLNSITDGLWHNKDGNRPANTPGTDNDLILLLSSCGLGRTDLFLFVMSANSERLYFRERYNNNTWRGWHTIAWLSDIPTVPSNIVNTFGTKTGDITLLNGLTGNGTINLTMSGNQLQASIVGLGTRAYDSNTYIRELDYYRYDSAENKAYRNYSGTGTEDYLKNLSMFAYDKAKNEIIGGRVHPNGLGIYLMRTYQDTGSTTGVPKYSGGLYLASSGCEAILFGYSNNNWFCNTIYHTGNLPAYPTVNNASLTLLTAGTAQTTFYANDNTNRTFNVTCENIGAATSTHNHNDKYVTFVGVTDDNTNHKNQLRYVLNGISNYFTVPYASTSDTAKYLNTNSVNANRVHKEINSSTSSYMYHLILLVAVLRTSNSSAYNYLEGKFFMFKTGGNVYDVVTVNLNLVYNILEYHIEYYGLNGAYTLCRCTYNGILYYALKCPYHANPFTNIIFDGYARSDWDSNNLSLPIDITYRCDYPSTTITNSEVNNSLTNTLETNVVTGCGHRALALPAGMIGNASSATNVAWSGITSKPNAVGDATHPVYWTGSGFTLANAYPTKSSWNYDDVYLKISKCSVSKSGETLTVKINDVTLSLTNTWRGILNNLTSDSTTDSLSAALGKVLKGLIDGALKLNPGSIASFGDYQRVVIALCETKDGTANAGDSYTVGEFQYHRSNGLCLTFSAHVNMNAAWGISRGAFYSLVTDYENTSTAARDGSGFRACTFTYNGKYYAGLEFYYTQGHYWTFHGISNFTPFVIAYYDIRGTVVNSEINNSLRYDVNSRLDTYLGTLRANGNAYALNFYTTSDRNKKTNISSFSEHIRKFQLKDTEKYAYGVIALEVEEMFRDGEEGNMTVNYNSILSFYIGSLENKVKMLEERIKRLESK